MSNEGKNQLDNLNNLIHFDDLLSRIKRAEVLPEKDYLRLIKLKDNKEEIAELKRKMPTLLFCLIVSAAFSVFSLYLAQDKGISTFLRLTFIIISTIPILAFVMSIEGLVLNAQWLSNKIKEQKEWDSEQENIKLAQKQYEDICGVVKDYISDPQQLFMKAILVKKELRELKEKEKCLHRYWKDRLEGLRSDILSQVAIKTKEEVLKTNEQMKLQEV